MRGELFYDYTRLLCIARLLQIKQIRNSLRIWFKSTGDANELFKNN